MLWMKLPSSCREQELCLLDLLLRMFRWFWCRWTFSYRSSEGHFEKWLSCSQWIQSGDLWKAPAAMSERPPTGSSISNPAMQNTEGLTPQFKKLKHKDSVWQQVSRHWIRSNMTQRRFDSSSSSCFLHRPPVRDGACGHSWDVGHVFQLIALLIYGGWYISESAHVGRCVCVCVCVCVILK